MSNENSIVFFSKEKFRRDILCVAAAPVSRISCGHLALVSNADLRKPPCRRGGEFE